MMLRVLPSPSLQARCHVGGGMFGLWPDALVVCKSVGLSLRAVDLAEDLVGIFGPGEGPGVVVPVIDERADRVGELAD
jgi:hypothetical protein